MAEGGACRAREAEIGELLEPVLAAKARSATLVYGDSGIGKSTLLREVENRLLQQPDVMVGRL